MPRGLDKKTKKMAFEAGLVLVTGTTEELMEELAVAYYNVLPHQWQDDRTNFMRGYFPRAMTENEIGIFTDFAAIFKHRQAFSARRVGATTGATLMLQSPCTPPAMKYLRYLGVQHRQSSPMRTDRPSRWGRGRSL
jgi:hypothetical protein